MLSDGRMKQHCNAKIATYVQDTQVREVWLSSEDTGAYGRDIGTGTPLAQPQTNIFLHSLLTLWFYTNLSPETRAEYFHG